MNALLLGRGVPDARLRLEPLLKSYDYELCCFERIEDARSFFDRQSPELVLLTYFDETILQFIDWGSARSRLRAVWAAVLDHEPDLSLEKLMDSGLDDLIFPPLTDFRLQACLGFIVRHARFRHERHSIEKALASSDAHASAIMETTVDGIVTMNERGIIESFNRAAERIFGYSAAEVIGHNVKILMPAPYREEHDGFIRSYHETGHRRIIGIGREVKGLRKNGEIFPLELSVSEVRPNGARTYTGVIRDITSRRLLEQELLATSEQERRRIGQDLHDGLGQMLTGIGLITQNLARQLEARDASEADELHEIVGLIREADQQARTLARTLIPIELDNGGLNAALHYLANNMNLLYGLPCSVEEVGSTPVLEAPVAAHFFRIIQEAMHNAARHSNATQLKVSIAGNKKQIRVRIQDNGIGIEQETATSQGMGLRIMKYRADVIGASLEVRRGSEDGTVVTCTLPLQASTTAIGSLKVD